MSQHFPRIRFHDSYGTQVIRDGLKICFYMRRSSRQVAPAVMQVLETYLRAVGPQRMEWYLDIEGDWQLLSPETWEANRRHLLEATYPRVVLTDDPSCASAVRFEYYGEGPDDAHGDTDPDRVSAWGSGCPRNSSMNRGRAVCASWLLELATPLPFNSGHAGLCFNAIYGYHETEKELSRLCLRYPGIDMLAMEDLSLKAGHPVEGTCVDDVPRPAGARRTGRCRGPARPAHLSWHRRGAAGGRPCRHHPGALAGGGATPRPASSCPSTGSWPTCWSPGCGPLGRQLLFSRRHLAALGERRGPWIEPSPYARAGGVRAEERSGCFRSTSYLPKERERMPRPPSSIVEGRARDCRAMWWTKGLSDARGFEPRRACEDGAERTRRPPRPPEDFDVVRHRPNMRGMSGLELCERIVLNRPDVPVVVITAFGQPRDGDRGDPRRRLRLHHQAGRPRRARARAGARRCSTGRCARRCKRLRAAVAARTALRRARRREPGDAAGLRPARARRRRRTPRCSSRARAAPARSSSRARSTSASRRRGGPVRRHQLRRHARGAARERALRPRARRLHRREGRARRASSSQANGGTLFLDEIGELPLELQPKLLRALAGAHGAPRRRRPARSRSTCASSPRPTATSRPRSTSGRFREDLYYRINVIQHRRCRRCARAAATCCCSRSTSSSEFAARSGKRVRGLSRARRPSSCSPTTGRATCASCRTASSAPSR